MAGRAVGRPADRARNRGVCDRRGDGCAADPEIGMKCRRHHDAVVARRARYADVFVAHVGQHAASSPRSRVTPSRAASSRFWAALSPTAKPLRRLSARVSNRLGSASYPARVFRSRAWPGMISRRGLSLSFSSFARLRLRSMKSFRSGPANIARCIAQSFIFQTGANCISK